MTDKTATAAWTLLTDADVATIITLQNKGPYPLFIKATVGIVTPPTANDLSDSLMYETGGGFEDTTIATLFPDVVGANRLWGATRTASGSKVTIKYAP